MGQAFHFISGLPRSGSTLLSAILRQNPTLHAHITSPVGSMVGAMLAEVSANHETSVFFDDARRKSVLRGCFSSYYYDTGDRIVFDTNRVWSARIELLAALYPSAKMICCIRHVPWILDSVERLIRSNAFELSGIFGFDKTGTVYTRAEGLMSHTGMIGYALGALRQAMHGAESSRILLLPYDLLTSDPKAAIDAVYSFTGLAPFAHQFDNVVLDAVEFDSRLGTPGLHKVRSDVAREERKTILPPDLWARYEGASFWRDMGVTNKPPLSKDIGERSP